MSQSNLVRTRNGPKPAQHLGMHVDASRDALSGRLLFCFAVLVVRAMCVCLRVFYYFIFVCSVRAA